MDIGPTTAYLRTSVGKSSGTRLRLEVSGTSKAMAIKSKLNRYISINGATGIKSSSVN